ncbi:hypothetical protein ID866_11426 [Astraeus odoratus]|nr:hypothetical protein ID866_11426 [Astraeus odoratus]
MVGVPTIWETIRKSIIAKVNASGVVKKTLFNWAYTLKKSNVPLLSQLADVVVLGSIRATISGRLRLALNGAAALSKEFLSIALVTVLQAYGMTESIAMCAFLPPELMQYGSVGLPSPAVEVKLRDVPEAGYKSTNDLPQGDVGRFNSDGTLSLIDRIKNLVKLKEESTLH